MCGVILNGHCKIPTKTRKHRLKGALLQPDGALFEEGKDGLRDARADHGSPSAASASSIYLPAASLRQTEHFSTMVLQRSQTCTVGTSEPNPT